MSFIGNSPFQGMVSGGNIQDGTVGTADLEEGAVVASKLGTYAVTTDKVADGAITAIKLAAGAAVPDQTGHAGQFLTTDGTTTNWATVDAYDQSLNTTDNVTFNQISSANDLALGTSAASTFTSIDMQNTTGWFYITQGTNGTYLTSVPDADQAFRIQNTNGDIKLEPSSGKSVVVTGTVVSDGLAVATSSVNVGANIATLAATVVNDLMLGTGAGIEWDHDARTTEGLHITTADTNSGAYPISFSTVNTSYAMKIDTNGNVGIGTTLPVAKLDINGNVYIRGTNTGLVINSPASDEMFITTNSANDSLLFGSGASVEQMRLDASGNLVLGTNTTNASPGFGNTVNGISLYGVDNAILVSRNNDSPLFVTRTGNDGTLIDLRKDGAPIGVIGSYNDGGISPYFADKGNVGIRLSQAGTDDIVPCDSKGANRNEAINLGSGEARWNNFFLSGGVRYANYTLIEESGFLYVYNGSTKIMRLDSSGNLAVIGNIEANATL